MYFIIQRVVERRREMVEDRGFTRLSGLAQTSIQGSGISTRASFIMQRRKPGSWIWK